MEVESVNTETMDAAVTDNTVIKTESSDAGVGPVKRRRRNMFDVKPEGEF